ncbi:hypothetical protein EZH22_23300 [Xanthobacter dioxanivorans]|uniref:Uncharacterized protein n=1 Tax=Xanthobacter dioxanivorans TaxID=2528964 RepID=A0A974PMW7_9HYPH|nr:hypothetical protein [Xanthobacter dioxanivorans]QRG05915.1 hypothetical protein EZH22_23300 [Xanthobacter dioxanivorans]
MTERRPIATLAAAISELCTIRQQLSAERKRAETRFDALAPPTVAEAMANPEALAAHHLARIATGLTTAEAAEDAVEEAIGSLTAAVLATPATTLGDLAIKATALERLAEGDSVIETSDIAGLLADIRRLADAP